MRYAIVGLALLLSACSAQEQNWYKGNTHTHTLWSDGDAPPEVSVEWYKSHGYDFLALSDHNILSQGDRWYAVRPDERLTPEHLAALKEQFGDAWPVLRGEGETLQMKLKTLPELKAHFESPDEFLLIQAEELTDAFKDWPVHVGAVNLQEQIPPQGGDSVYDVMQRNVDAVRRQSEQTGHPMLTHLNHPNFGWGVTAEDLIKLEGDRFFEVFNGHPGVRNWGDAAHPGTDRMWDIVNSMRLTQKQPVLFGVATDDTHHYYEMKVGKSNAGRGWVMVNAARLDPDEIIRAMQRGDFYATTGVLLETVRADRSELRIEVAEEEGVTYSVQFIGTKRGFDSSSVPNDDPSAHISNEYSQEIGEVLLETADNPAVYRFTGKELYVRAKIVSTKQHPNPFKGGDLEMAWTQPVVVE